jgi:glycerol-3-phosphate dehydrogenase (NAD(P)+)
MTSVAIIGAGSFGTALACAARRAGLATTMWAREPEVAEALNAGRGNPFFLPGISVEAGIRACSDIGEALAGVGFVLLAVPAQFLRGVAERMRPALQPGVPVISCSKGIEQGSCALMPEVIADALPDTPLGVLAGPSFARELALDMPTGVTLASRERAWAEPVAKNLASARFRVYTSGDPISATIGGAYKNVLAIACGIAIARRMGENARGLLVARGLYEMACMARAKGGNPVNLLGLAGAGDVTLTCMGTQSRNITFGIALGEGRSPAAILAERKVVTEGVPTAKSLTELGRRLGVRMPVASAVNRVVNEGGSVDEALAALLGQPTGAELGDLMDS